MEFILENWVVILTSLIAILTALKLTVILPYVNFAKETGDVYLNYKTSMKNGVFTDAEKIAFADEVVEMVESGKEAFKGKPKK